MVYMLISVRYMQHQNVSTCVRVSVIHIIFSNDFKYANLLEHKDVKGDDDVDGKVPVGANNAKIAEFCFNLIMLEDLKDDFLLGCRQKEDLTGAENTVGTL